MQDSLIDQLEGALASKELSRRAEVLRHVTDLFVFGSGKFTGEQIDLFDEVMSKLVETIELSARVAFGSRLARLPDAPGKTIRLLAFDDAIDVAAPVLEHSPRLDEADLTENARTKSQDHLLAIAGRRLLSEPVTDVLLERGSNEVTMRTAGNRGAKFSIQGMSTLVRKARDDGALATCIWSRPEIPRETLLKLFGQASELVRRKLEAANPRQAAEVRDAILRASDELQSTARTGSGEYAQAFADVRSMDSQGILDEARLLGFVAERSFDRTAVALSLMCNLPIGVMERALASGEPEQLLILARAIGLSWQTTKAVLMFQGGPDEVTRERLDTCFASFQRLKPSTAKAALQFYRLRERANQGPTH
ncbi:DUF2336 domain-containing protein [Bradyrhizobium sp. 14AA]